MKKILPLIALALMTACAPTPVATTHECECCKKTEMKCECCKDGTCEKCKGKKGKHKQCPPKHDHGVK